MGSSEMDKPAKEKEKELKTAPPTTQVLLCVYCSCCYKFEVL